MSIEEYDDGYGSKEDFERAGADQPEHMEDYEWPGDAVAHATLMERAHAYDTELDRLEIAPNGDDYSALLAIIGGLEVPLPTLDDR